MSDQPGVGREIMRRRKRLGIGPVDFARMAGVSRQTLEDTEAGKRVPRDRTLRKMLDALEKFEEETGDDDVPSEDSHGLVTFRIRGNFGVDATVQGPVDDIDRLEVAAQRLLKQAMERGSESSE